MHFGFCLINPEMNILKSEAENTKKFFRDSEITYVYHDTFNKIMQ